MSDAAFHVRMVADREERFGDRQAVTRTAELQQEIDHLRLTVAALWSLLAERDGPTLDDLVARMDELDRRDGVRDGRYAPRPRPCPQCAAMVAAGRVTCQFCGAAVAGADPFA